MTETIAVVFTDLVDSTRLLSSLGDDAFDEVRREHFAVLRSVIADHRGEEVKNLGDGLMAVFRSASDAIGAAVAMQVETDRWGRRAEATPVGLKVGASIGDATPEDGDWFGTPVVEAARLCALATSGQLLITEMTRMMAGSRSGERFEPIGLVELKGLPDPVAVCEVRWEASAPVDGAPLPGALETAAALPFAGRAAALAALQNARLAAEGGSARTVFIAGEPGIGKTRLAAQVCRELHDGGAVVLLGRSEDEIDAPFRPFSEALEQLVRHAPDGLIDDHVAAVGTTVATLVPELAGRTQAPAYIQVGGADPDAQRLQLFHAVADLLRRQCEVAPLVIVLDDVHWADRSSLLLLRHLVDALAETRLLVLATYRDTDLDRSHPLANVLADFRRVAGVQRISLDGLSQAEVIEYLAIAGGHDLEPEGVDLGRQLAQITDGNPFFLTETLRHLAEEGAIVERDGRWVAGDVTAEEVGVPEGIREVVGRRLSALDPDIEGLLRVAAVAGTHFDCAVIGAVAGLAEDVVVDGLDVACERALAAEDTDRFGWYRFAHALVRQTLLEELSTTKRIRLHRALGEELERVAPDRVPEIAVHYLEAAAAGTAAKAVVFAERAGQLAMARTATEQAIGWFRRALEAEESLPADPVRRCELLLHLGEARNRSHEELDARSEHREAAALARSAGRPDLLARAAYGYLGIFGFWVAMDDQERRPLVEEALAGLPADEHPELEVLLLSKVVMERSFDVDPTERHRLSERAAAIARTLDDPNAHWDGIAWRFNALVGSVRVEVLESLIDELDTLSDHVDVVRRAFTHYFRMIARMNSGDFVGAHAEADAYARIVAPIGIAESQMVLGEPATRAMISGEFEQAHRMFDELRRATRVDGTALAAGAGQLWMELWSGNADGTRVIIDGFPASAAGFVTLYPLGANEAILRNDLLQAQARYEEWKSLLAFMPADILHHVATCATYATWRLADAEVAGALVAVLEPLSGQWTVAAPAMCHGPDDLHVGTNLLTLGRTEEAESVLRAAVESTQRSGAPMWEAVAQFFHALALREVGRSAESEAAAEVARRLATSFGMRLVLDDLDRAGLAIEIESLP